MWILSLLHWSHGNYGNTIFPLFLHPSMPANIRLFVCLHIYCRMFLILSCWRGSFHDASVLPLESVARSRGQMVPEVNSVRVDN